MLFDQKLIEYLNNWTIGEKAWPIGNLLLCVIALVLCVILIGLIGIERERRGRSAGLRTHLLVGVGSTIIMIISIYGFPAIFSEHRDVARLAAQIVTGVGFLGAGAIIHRNSGIRGLTTAGTIWASMAIGLACGSYNFILAILGTTIIIVVLTIFRKLEAKIGAKNPYIVIQSQVDFPAITIIMKVANEFNCTIDGLNTTFSEAETNMMEITFHAIFTGNEIRVMDFVNRLEQEIGVGKVHILNHI